VSVQLKHGHKRFFPEFLGQVGGGTAHHAIAHVVEQPDDKKRDEKEHVVFPLLQQIILLKVLK